MMHRQIEVMCAQLTGSLDNQDVERGNVKKKCPKKKRIKNLSDLRELTGIPPRREYQLVNRASIGTDADVLAN